MPKHDDNDQGKKDQFKKVIEQLLEGTSFVSEINSKLEQALLKFKNDNSCDNNIDVLTAAKYFHELTDTMMRLIVHAGELHVEITHDVAHQLPEENDLPDFIKAIILHMVNSRDMRKGKSSGKDHKII